MIPIRAVSDETMKSASSFAEIRGAERRAIEEEDRAMLDEILASERIGNGRSVHIATLSRETIRNAGAEHLGFGGYFLFEAVDEPMSKGISILGKACSLEAAIEIVDLWADRRMKFAT